jgi:glycerol kinase
MISWQDQRTVEMSARLAREGHADTIRALSGLPLDPMFSALKAGWLLDEYDPDRRRSSAGELCLGTVDSWLLYCIGGSHVIEVGNASRTQLLNVREGTWDDELLEIFRVPRRVLPRILPSTATFCHTRGLAPLADGVPVAGVMGDSHAALFAQMGWRLGRVKVTYGSGSSVMAVTPVATSVPPGLCLTIPWDIDGRSFAMEGTTRAAGSTLVLSRRWSTKGSR